MNYNLLVYYKELVSIAASFVILFLSFYVNKRTNLTTYVQMAQPNVLADLTVLSVFYMYHYSFLRPMSNKYSPYV